MKKILLTCLAITALGCGAALAQVNVPQPIAKPETGAAARARLGAQPAPPVGVPGSRAEPALVAPAERAPTDMPPTEALFDSINRGDLSAAKEAVNRGADIHGHNVLGLTPLEQSVDLGRSDISFLLLSLRSGAGYSTASGPVRNTQPTEPKTPAELRAERQAEQLARRQQAIEARAAVRQGAQASAPARNARLFAGDGGAPVPQAGFLGFDSAR